MGHGTKLAVEEGSTVVFGDDFHITAEASVASRLGIVFTDNVLVSWDVQIMDSDWHAIVDLDGRAVNPDPPVRIGDHVWIGCRAMILKGVTLPNDCIVAAGSGVSSTFDHPRSIVGGVPAREIRSDVSWTL